MGLKITLNCPYCKKEITIGATGIQRINSGIWFKNECPNKECKKKLVIKYAVEDDK